MYTKLQAAFYQRYKHHPSCILKSPGRINLIGEHLDYNHGFVMPAAIDKGIYFAMALSIEKYTALHSLDYNETYRSDEEERPPWTKYIRAVMRVLKGKGYNVQRFQGLLTSDLPIGAGLSSSAALCVGFTFALNEIHHWNLSRLEMALIAQEAEHQVGIKCGLMDQYALLHGREAQVFVMDCLTNSHSYFPAVFDDYQLLLINSKVSHSLVDTAYNHRRENCEAAFKILQAKYPTMKTFRDLSPSMLDDSIDLLSTDQYDFVKYVVEEIQRVHDMSVALSEKNIPQVGAILSRGHEGLKTLYRVTCKETDALVDLASEYPEVLGLRQMGGGFGGCVIGLVKKEAAVRISQELATKYQEITGIEPEVIPVHIGPGVGPLVAETSSGD